MSRPTRDGRTMWASVRVATLVRMTTTSTSSTKVRRVVAGRLLTAGLTAPVLLTGPTYAAKAPRCHGQVATIVGTNGPDEINGTKGEDVIVGLDGRDEIAGHGGGDLICGGADRDHLRSSANGVSTLDGGPGNDDLFAQGRGDALIGGPGKDEPSAAPDAGG